MSVQTAIANAIAAAISEAGASLDAETIEGLFSEPPNRELGDIAFPCFQLARQLRKAPPAIAVDLAERVAAAVQEIAAVTWLKPTGPYLNFKLDSSATARTILSAAVEPTFGNSDVGAGKTIGIDFSSPNIAKPFGIGHLRSTAIGNAIGSLYRALGYRVVGINHLGDWGTQFGKMMAAYERWGDPAKLDAEPIAHLYELYVKFHEEAKVEPTLNDEGRAWFKKLEDGDEKAVAYWSNFRALSLREFERIYARLGVTFEHYWGEAYYNEMLGPFVDDLKATGLTEESEGALVVKLDDLDVPPCLIVKSDGATLYATRDLTAARYRYEQLQFDQFLYVVGHAQQVHFRQVFAVLDRMGLEWAQDCHHIAFGMILGISTRKGTLVFLEDILDRGRDYALEAIADRPNLNDEERAIIAEQVAVGAVVFSDLSRNRMKDYDFSWKQILHGLRPGESGRTGPYLQYTAVRLASVRAKFEEQHGALAPASEIDFSLLGEDKTQAVIAHLGKFPDTIAQAAEKYEPAILSRYLLDLAEVFNSFYSGGDEYRVVTDNAALSAARVTLVEAARQTLVRGLSLLGVPIPEKM